MALSQAPINILEVLDGMEFPASVPEIVAFAEDRDASEEVLDELQAMPERIYNSIEDVNRHLGEIAVEEGEENIYSSAAGLDEFRAEPEAADDVNLSRADVLT